VFGKVRHRIAASQNIPGPKLYSRWNDRQKKRKKKSKQLKREKLHDFMTVRIEATERLILSSFFLILTQPTYFSKQDCQGTYTVLLPLKWYSTLDFL